MSFLFFTSNKSPISNHKPAEGWRTRYFGGNNATRLKFLPMHRHVNLIPRCVQPVPECAVNARTYVNFAVLRQHRKMPLGNFLLLPPVINKPPVFMMSHRISASVDHDIKPAFVLEQLTLQSHRILLPVSGAKGHLAAALID